MRLSEITEARYYREPKYYIVLVDGEYDESGSQSKKDLEGLIRYNKWDETMTNWQQHDDQSISFDVPKLFSKGTQRIVFKPVKI